MPHPQTKKSAFAEVKKFHNIRQEVWEFNSDHWSFFGKLIPTKMERGIGRLWGWHRIIYGRKGD